METELWFGIGHYFLGIIIIFALLVALMESSRKYDRFRETSYLLQSIGYFFLLVWALLFAMLLGESPLLMVAAIAQVLGLTSLTIGYYIYHHAHPFATDHEDEPAGKKVAPGKVSAGTVNDESLVALLSATSGAASREAEEKLEDETEEPEDSEKSDGSLSVETADAKVMPESTEYQSKVVDITAEAAPKKIAKKTTKKEVNVESSEETVDLSYLAGRKAGVKKKVAAPKTKEEGRDTLMDELFPLQDKGSADEQEDGPVEPIAPKVSVVHDDKLPGEHRDAPADNSPMPDKLAKPAKSAKKSMPAAAFLMLDQLPVLDLSAAWAEMAAALATFLLVLLLLPQRGDRGSRYLLGGFAVICVASVMGAFVNPQLLGNIPSTSSELMTLLPVRIMQCLGFVLLGLAGWVRIKGKVTHHFLRIVSFVYVVLLLLTVGLASVIVNDIASLQLLLVLMTGVLMTILPIIHSLTYSHPDHRAAAEQKDDK